MAFETTLPGRYFYDPEIYAREQERLFGQMWTCVGRADALPTAGDFKTVELAGESVLIVRGRDGELRAFLNVCRHRGARLCLEPCGNTGAAIQCMYHAWSYALDGRLIGAPNIARDESLDRESLGLVPVHLDVWEGLIWLSLAEDPAPVTAQLEPALRDRFGELEKFRRYDVGSLAVGHIDHLRDRRELEAGRRELHGVLPLRSGPPRADQSPPRFPPRHLLSGDRRSGHRVRRRYRRLHPLWPG